MHPSSTAYKQVRMVTTNGNSRSNRSYGLSMENLSTLENPPILTRENFSFNDQFGDQAERNQRTDGNLHVRSGDRRMRVEDAIIYLDQVKQQFLHSPNIYMHFLDIMKDFKSQVIDTPGVITRVSSLFRGHPNLIMGFNTFLPVGFRVNIDGSKIMLSEPSGRRQVLEESSNEDTTMNTSDAADSQSPEVMELAAVAAASPSSSIPIDKDKSVVIGNLTESDSAVQSEIVEGVASISIETPATEMPLSSSEPAVPPSTDECMDTSAAADPSSLQENLTFPDEKAAALYHQAMSYVDRVRERYGSDVSSYNRFLDILQQFKQISTSTEDSEQIKKVEVQKQFYKMVADLFKDDRNLLKDLSSFLPKVVTSDSGTVGTSDQVALVQANTSSPQTSAAVVKTILGKRASSPISIVRKKSKLGEVNVISYEVDMDEAVKYATVDDMLFFDKVRHALVDGDVYGNFLRCITMYNQSVITKNELIEIIVPFIGKYSMLMNYLKGLVAKSDDFIDKKNSREKNTETGKQEIDVDHRKDFATRKSLGASYRSLYKSDKQSASDGQTKLGKSVLNDKWASFPSWSSEDSSSVHSKKTSFEELIFRIDDERFEFDIIIEVNKAALETLESVNRRMVCMKKDERNRFTLNSALGGTSPSIMRQALHRIYGFEFFIPIISGRDHWQKMLDGAMKNPQLMIPRLIERLKMKHTEWSKAQLQYNKVWHNELVANYEKSLDHQIVTFKQNDAKFLKTKSIINQFENMYVQREERSEQCEQKESGPNCIFHYPNDTSIIYDAHDLLIHYVKRQANIQKDEKRQTKRYLKRFIPELFNISPQDLSDDEDCADVSGKECADIEMSSADACEEIKAAVDENKKADSTFDAASKSRLRHSLTYGLFYGANAWCIFLKLHHLLCDRLGTLKRKEEELIENYEMEERIKQERENIIQQNQNNENRLRPIESDIKLGLHSIKPLFPCPKDFYKSLITEIKSFLDGIIDANAFEESARQKFGVSAYIIFSVDKVISTIARQLQALITETFNIKTMELYKQHRAEKLLSCHVECQNSLSDEAYEKSVQKVLENQNCFKTYFIHSSNIVTIELIDSEKTDISIDNDAEPNQGWLKYIRSYLESLSTDVKSMKTETARDHGRLIDNIGRRPPLFLRRSIKRRRVRTSGQLDAVQSTSNQAVERINFTGNNDDFVIVKEDMHVRFSSATGYRMQFVNNSSDLLIRKTAPHRIRRSLSRDFMMRRRLFSNWLSNQMSDESEYSNWLAGDARVVHVHHPAHVFITYNRYVTTPQSPTSDTIS